MMDGGYNGDRDLCLASPCNLEVLEDNGMDGMERKQNEGTTTPSDDPEAGHSQKGAGADGKRGKPGKFKRLVRMMLAQNMWMKDVKDNNIMERAQGLKTGSEKLSFNPSAYKAHVKSCGRLSQQAINILQKYPDDRTDREIRTIHKILYRLKCFDRYPLHLKKELSRKIYFDRFDDGRLIIKQGRPGISFYFIISGSVVVERTEWDPYLKKYYVQKVGELSSGDSFGELSLLHNTKRAASVICRGTSEFLRIDKEEFDEVLRNSHEREWEMRANILGSHPVFHGWSERELKIVNMHSKTKTYSPNAVIVSEQKPRSDRIFFIASGSCVVVRKLDLLKVKVSERKYKYRLPPLKPIKKYLSGVSGTAAEAAAAKPNVFPDRMPKKVSLISEVFTESSNGSMYCNLSDPQMLRRKQTGQQPQIGDTTKETKFFTIKELGQGDYFNVGECLEGIYVISVGRVEVVQVGTSAFSRHNDRLKSLYELRLNYIQNTLSLQETYNKYILERKWNCYKKNQVLGVTERRRRQHQIDFEDVPGVLSLDQVYYADPMEIV